MATMAKLNRLGRKINLTKLQNVDQMGFASPRNFMMGKVEKYNQKEYINNTPSTVFGHPLAS